MSLISVQFRNRFGRGFAVSMPAVPRVGDKVTFRDCTRAALLFQGFPEDERHGDTWLVESVEWVIDRREDTYPYVFLRNLHENHP